MRNLAVLGEKAHALYEKSGCVQTLVMNGVAVHLGLIETPEPAFDRDAPANEHSVLLRVTAFSLNYRDKNRIFTMALKGTPDAYYVIGSEFSGVVLKTGPAVTSVAPGDRVIGDNNYPSSGWPGVAPGVPTNHSSKEFLILHEAKLIKVPDGMPDAVAAAFSIGAQTSYGMIRRLGIANPARDSPPVHVLVTSAKSNTSLFSINALRKYGVDVFATSTTDLFAGQLKAMGIADVAVIGHDTRFVESPVLREVLERAGGFPFVIDPFSDLHLARALEVMAFGGRYITCGFYDQYLRLIGQQPPAPQARGPEMFLAVIKNLEIVGNCAGTTEDLSNALRDYASGALDVVIDSVWSRGQFAEFLTRTYCSPERFGKVVYQYD